MKLLTLHRQEGVEPVAWAPASVTIRCPEAIEEDLASLITVPAESALLSFTGSRGAKAT